MCKASVLMTARRQILGDNVHVTALIGAENALEGGQDIGADTEWVHSEAAPQTTRNTGAAWPRDARVKGRRARGSAGPSLYPLLVPRVQAWPTSSGVPDAHVSVSKTWAHCYGVLWISQRDLSRPFVAGRALAPTVLALQSPHVDLQLHGWRTTTGMVLREPATATVEFTPSLARWAASHTFCAECLGCDASGNRGFELCVLSSGFLVCAVHP